MNFIKKTGVSFEKVSCLQDSKVFTVKYMYKHNHFFQFLFYHEKTLHNKSSSILQLCYNGPAGFF